MNEENHGHFLGSSGCRRLSLWEKYLFISSMVSFDFECNLGRTEGNCSLLLTWEKTGIHSIWEKTQVSTCAFVFICYTILKKKCYNSLYNCNLYINYYITQKVSQLTLACYLLWKGHILIRSTKWFIMLRGYIGTERHICK